MKVAVSLRAHNQAHSQERVHFGTSTATNNTTTGDPKVTCIPTFRNPFSTGSYSLIIETRGLRVVHGHRYRCWIVQKYDIRIFTR